MERSQATHRKLLGGLGFIAVLVVLSAIGIIFAQRATSRDIPAGTTQAASEIKAGGRASGIGKLLFKQDFSVWGYEALKDDAQNSWITINYRHDSVTALQNYIAANKALIPDLEYAGSQAEVAITFRQPLSPDQFRTWVKKQEVQVREAQLAAGKITIGVGGTAGDPLPQTSIDKAPYAGLNGVFGVYGSVDANKLSVIAADPEVYLLDVTPAWSRRDLVRAGIAEAAEQRTQVQVDLAYGWMEQLGMIPTATLPLPVGTSQPPPGTVMPTYVPPFPPTVTPGIP